MLKDRRRPADSLPLEVDSHLDEVGDLNEGNTFGDPVVLPYEFSLSSRAETTQSVSRSWKRASVEEMLIDLVKSQPDYQVEVFDGVVHVFPPSLKSSGKNFLNLTVESLELHDQVVEIASHLLRETPSKSFVSPVGGNLQGA